MAAASPFSQHDDGVRIRVRVTPRAKRDAVAGIVEDGDGRSALAIRLAAPPVDGAANKALIAFLSGALGVGRSSVRVLSGGTSRLKLVEVTGVTIEAVSHRLETGPD